MLCGMHGGPGGERGARARTALRWLGAPPTVLALVVLVLNDHVWKHQWPGPVTGKVSDVAGLLVAPPLIALAMSPLRMVRRPDRWAVAAVALGFTATKTSDAGAATASAAWSIITPSFVRADATDLLALPVLLVALATARWARAPGPDLRRRATLAVGALVLPGAVLGTAATSACMEHPEVRAVTAVSGRLATSPLGWTEDFVVKADHREQTVQGGALVDLTPEDRERVEGAEGTYRDPFGTTVTQACSRAQRERCWRLPTRGRVLVEASTDGGRTWARDYAPGKRYREEVVAELGEKCDEAAVFDVTDVAVADTPDGPVVAVALRAAGLAVRSASGSWTRVPFPDDEEVGTPVGTTSPPPSLSGGTSSTGAPGGTDRPTPAPEPLVPLDPLTPHPPEPTGGRPTGPPTRSCTVQCQHQDRTPEPAPTRV
ncbi:hypothetical protein GCM10009867_24470 [Pedococcus aerophilus]|uniref:Uncharacterized protein n=2 Tax=Pedococcus aerophilus TaxID=436356 RepID=A0ABN3UR15_9MICO